MGEFCTTKRRSRGCGIFIFTVAIGYNDKLQRDPLSDKSDFDVSQLLDTADRDCSTPYIASRDLERSRHILCKYVLRYSLFWKTYMTSHIKDSTYPNDQICLSSKTPLTRLRTPHWTPRATPKCSPRSTPNRSLRTTPTRSLYGDESARSRNASGDYLGGVK